MKHVFCDRQKSSARRDLAILVDSLLTPRFVNPFRPLGCRFFSTGASCFFAPNAEEEALEGSPENMAGWLKRGAGATGRESCG